MEISAEVVRPYADRPFDGIFSINTEVSPMCTAANEYWNQAESELIISRLIEKAIRRSNALDTESLCIIAGEKCWSIRADVHFINNDGSLADACCIGVVAALAHFRRPDVTIRDGNVIVHTFYEKVAIPLSLLHLPVTVTLSFYSECDFYVVDTTLQEELIRNGEVTVTINRHGELCQILKSGGVPLDANKFSECIVAAQRRAMSLSDYLQQRLKEQP